MVAADLWDMQCLQRKGPVSAGEETNKQYPETFNVQPKMIIAKMLFVMSIWDSANAEN